MPITHRHMKVFSAVIEAGSVSRAATRLNLTQPAVSIALSNLEAELGFSLFYRSKGFFAPTTEALHLHGEVTQSLLAFARMHQRADEIRSGAVGAVSIAANGALAINFLPKVIADFQVENAGLSVELKVHSSRQIASLVSGGQVDIGLIDTPVPVAGLKAEVFRLECVCIMRDDDPLQAVSVVRPDDLSGRCLIGITGDHTVDRQVDSVLSQARIDVKRSVSSAYFAIARNLVAAGGNLSIIDPINGKARLSDGVLWKPFEPLVEHELAIIVARERLSSRSTDTMYEMIKTAVQQVRSA
ncbi:LysR substrate-binding domain-containing protein [Rhodobacteraceae bacterium]|nr:LysR substrate-binding domain-containing protein [Paracoccaceae bacterium]